MDNNLVNNITKYKIQVKVILPAFLISDLSLTDQARLSA